MGNGPVLIARFAGAVCALALGMALFAAGCGSAPGGGDMTDGRNIAASLPDDLAKLGYTVENLTIDVEVIDKATGDTQVILVVITVLDTVANTFDGRLSKPLPTGAYKFKLTFRFNGVIVATSPIFDVTVDPDRTTSVTVPGPPDVGHDDDGDGLFNIDEFEHGPDPGKPDSDEDGLTDGDEVDLYGTDPLDIDTDGDALPDGDEVDIYGSDPLDTDTDDDALLDGDEVNLHGTNPADADSDDDDLSDGDEVRVFGTDPTLPTPADIANFDFADAGNFGAVATAIGLIDGLTQRFGAAAAVLAKPGGRVKVAARSDCPVIDITGFDPDTYPPGVLPDNVFVVYDFTGSIPGCVDEDGNPLSGSYSIDVVGLADETWPVIVDGGFGGFTDLYHWRFDGATLVYDFDDLTVDLPTVHTRMSGTLKMDVATSDPGVTTKVTTNVTNIQIALDDSSTSSWAIVSRTGMTLTEAASSSPPSADGTFRLTFIPLGYIDATLFNVTMNEAVCPHHPSAGTVQLKVESGDTVSVDFDTGTCFTANVTLVDGINSEEVVPPIF